MQGSARATIARGSPSRARIRSAGRAWGALLAVIAFVTLLVALLWPRRIVCSVSPKARADIAQIPVASASYDAVVCFGVIHHAPDWRHALRETYRVLRPGGQLCLEESYAAFISHPLWRRLMNHPEHDRPDAPALLRALGEVGFVEVREQRLGEYLGLVVCRRPA